MNNLVKPTKKQEATFKHMAKAKSLQEAMLKGGYSPASSTHPKENFLDREGVKPLIEQYREDLINAGISLGVLAEIQAEGLFDQNAAVRLGYLKETKKDLGLLSDNDNSNIKRTITATEYFGGRVAINYKEQLPKLNIVNKDGVLVPFSPNEEQIKFLDTMTNKSTILKARQIGFSTLILGMFTLDFLMKHNSRRVAISHEAKAAQRLLDRVKFSIDQLNSQRCEGRSQVLK